MIRLVYSLFACVRRTRRRKKEAREGKLTVHSTGVVSGINVLFSVPPWITDIHRSRDCFDMGWGIGCHNSTTYYPDSHPTHHLPSSEKVQ